MTIKEYIEKYPEVYIEKIRTVDGRELPLGEALQNLESPILMTQRREIPDEVVITICPIY